jgi:glyoxylate/hydroxypyruvate reductase A
MPEGALALLIRGGSDNWSVERWHTRFSEVLPGRRIAVAPEHASDMRGVSYAAVWNPERGKLARLPDLKVIFNLGAGVDAVLADRSTPAVPLVRVAADDLTASMTEYIVMHTLMHHRQQSYLAACQARREWAPRKQWAANAVRVGILGLGVLGRHAAAMLVQLGFQVAGWSNTQKHLQAFAGSEELGRFLRRTDILVCLLPLTRETQGFLNASLFAQLAQDGPLGGPVLINAGRGGLQNEADILASLDGGTLKAATLDVFQTEPLAPSSLLWTHPAVTISPHNAADSDPSTIVLYVADQIRAFESGKPLRNVVDRERGY